MQAQAFETALSALPFGYSEGHDAGQRYGLTLRCSGHGKRISLFARQLTGPDIVGFNLYRLSSGESGLKPCEMSCEKVVAFVRGYVSDAGKAAATREGGKARVASRACALPRCSRRAPDGLSSQCSTATQ